MRIFDLNELLRFNFFRVLFFQWHRRKVLLLFEPDSHKRTAYRHLPDRAQKAYDPMIGAFLLRVLFVFEEILLRLLTEIVSYYPLGIASYT